MYLGSGIGRAESYRVRVGRDLEALRKNGGVGGSVARQGLWLRLGLVLSGCICRVRMEGIYDVDVAGRMSQRGVAVDRDSGGRGWKGVIIF
jgi:hypothetical protein